MSNDKSQIDRFKETAKKIGADESDKALDKAMKGLDLTRPPEDTKDKDKKPAK